MIDGGGYPADRIDFIETPITVGANKYLVFRLFYTENHVEHSSIS